MSTKMTRYQDDRQIVSGTTTVVYGTTTPVFVPELQSSFEKTQQAFDGLFRAPVTKKGVARLAEGDQFEASTGRVVASKKAERLGNRVMRQKVAQVVKCLEAMTAQLKGELQALDSRYAHLKEDKH